jgi:glycosyltransferase involved in cell wall biosynthesis
MGLQDSVRFHGSVANQEVLAAMNRAACVVVPSRPEYAEGMPGVVYEAFESRTPVVCSSHPSFAGLLREGRGCAVFEAKDPLDLSRALDRAVSDADTYAGLSATTLQAWMALRCPVTFADLVLGWLDATEEQAGPVLSGLTLAEVNGDAP